ncbi:DUF805 domain-containing protein [Pseudomonas alliivorans]|uniref:DUF805 domain-containing protein n=1 Tax=Pseudomonas alliivorans TaxID=2810613 RepID=A0ABS4C660_9PSED|nr:DUF805 domain-containing protein [Pseudomonas alliivorans]MBP0946146.1 DUF805 domain-containing protein [Pseudomonas alliivorans]MEE4326671.1 DUF805 domain-containing protein [Pseudomonas alliivorans]MEE4333424.1 DUF805 domain-containing protein [Pseudomonas alliivorans]MEE4368201.1 DUF805 domain-containing protein [Pseudomonas alliivorans]MEE4688210.1 DUF805 domain-containing protein [Pseudomonas alliivorans]
MAETHFKIVFEGQVRDGVEPEIAKANLARLFNSETAAVEKLFNGQTVALKRGLPHAEAEHYIKALHDAGVEARIEPDPAITLTVNEKDLPAPASPYAPPKSHVGPAEFAEHSTLKVFSIAGRIGRLRYLAWTLVLSAVSLALLSIAIMVMSQSLIAGGLLIAIIAMAFVVISSLMGVQRLHDIGWSGWLLLLNLVPFVSSVFPILMTVMPGTKGPNQYGAPQPPNSRGVKALAGLWLLLIPVILISVISGGMNTLKEELEVQTDEYEQSLPYDDAAQRESAQPNQAETENAPEEDNDPQ